MHGVVLPFRQFVLKVHSRCDLACDHCYVYSHADQTWRDKPKVISSETVAAASGRIAEHARAHGLARVTVILHGGEPLLAGASRLAAIARTLRQVIGPVCDLDLRIHTNGIRLDEEFCELFLAERVAVGISIDGDRAANDRHRRYASGRSSHDEVVRAIGLLRRERYRPLYAGLLATVDIGNDPLATYQALAAHEPGRLDFLLPHGTYEDLPPGIGNGTPYGDWLAAVFDAWLADGKPMSIRMFDSIISASRGGPSLTESLGLEPSDIAVIETDGTIEQADSIKVAYHGAAATALDVYSQPLDVAAAHPGIRARQQGVAGLCATCRQCPLVATCGGGLYAHRYRHGAGFDNPSVYCADLKKIINHVRARAGLVAAPRTAADAGPATALLMADDQFDKIAAGYGDAAAVEQLITAERSFLRKLLELLRARVSERSGTAFFAGLELLTRLEEEHGDAVGEVLAHPYVKAWAEHCLRNAIRNDGSGTVELADTGHLAGIAAAAAIRAGALAELEVPARDGYLYLPTLGRLNVGPVPAVTVAAGPAGFEAWGASGKWRVVAGTAEPDRAWQPVRELRAGELAVRLEDTDPYRDRHQWPPSDRLTDADVSRWAAQFADAWTLIRDQYPAYATGIAAGLTTLMPLAGDAAGQERSAASRQAFAAVGVALPVDGAALALLVLHEFQHVKLGAMLDLFKLYDPGERRLFFAPWRDDPRPLGGLLQGTYAHIAVTDFWRGRRRELPAPASVAAAERFATWRVSTVVAIEELLGSGALTALGARLVTAMRETVEPWLDEPVPAAAEATAASWIAERRGRFARAQRAGRG
jgi:uncharacterized protein